MTKVHLICSNDPAKFEYSINEFIKDKEVLDIKFQSAALHDQFTYSGIPTAMVAIDKALIIYKEDSNDESR